MANHPSALKRARQNEKRRARNASVRTRVRNLMKKVRKSIEEKDISKAQQALSEAIPQIQKAGAKGVLHRNTAGRYVSRLTRKVNELRQAAV